MSKYLRIGKKLPGYISEIDDHEKDNIRAALCQDKNFIEFCDNKIDWTHEEHDWLKNILELPRNEYGYYKDIYGMRVSYNGIRTLKRAKCVLPLTKIHENEIKKCRDSFVYFREHYCLITTKTGLARPDPRAYQEALEKDLLSLDDVVILYPRQSGKTVTSGNYLLWRALFHPDAINIGIVANKPSTAAEVLSKIKKTSIELPIWMQKGISIWNQGSIEFENGTRLMTDGPSSDSFRGYTINIVYLDELAYFKKSLWDEFSDSVFPTMNSLIFKQVVMTSTANGMNHFSKLCHAAEAPDTPERFITTSWRNVPHYSKQGKLLDPETYKKLTIKKFGKKYFAQTEECVFLGSSDTLVGGDTLREIGNHLEKVVPIPTNIMLNLDVYKTVEEGDTYIVSCDPSKDGIDMFAVNVVNISRFPFEQVATANLDIDYLVMPEHLNELGLYYNEAMIIVEGNEGAGQSITDTLFGVYEYPSLYRDKNINNKPGYKKYTGFRTTTKSRPIILNLMKIFIEEGKLIINSEKTLEQMYTFTKKKTGLKYQAEDGYFDDLIMSLAIAFAPFMTSKTFDNYELFTKELRKEDSELRTSVYLSTLDFGFTSEEDDEYLKELKHQREIIGGETDYFPDGGLVTYY